MKQVRAHRFRGRRWKIRWDQIPARENALGYCETPGQMIVIDPRMAGVGLLEVAIHESLHACLPDADEAAVTETAADVAQLLWRVGYRLEEDLE